MAAIDDFLAQKKLAPNSLSAYRYDLEQFRDLVSGQIEPKQLLAYQQFLKSLKPRAQKRKLSAVNQFLYYLYEEGHLKTYHRLQAPVTVELEEGTSPQILDLDILWEDTDLVLGQLFALMILTMGLQPSEILSLTADDLKLDFGVLTVTRAGDRRVLKLPEVLKPYLLDLPDQSYLFAKEGKPYTRQWLTNHLRAFLDSLGLKGITAQKLREQYILKSLAAGLSLAEVAKTLGLKSLTSLEKYQVL